MTKFLKNNKEVFIIAEVGQNHQGKILKGESLPLFFISILQIFYKVLKSLLKFFT
tara:strand:+ start:966 stop:1130 length:165 start_codon:yes stop_codon:yes gene_type:complete